MRNWILITFYFLLLFLGQQVLADSPSLKFGAFVDTYYAYDVNRPKNHEREYTTQPARHNEVALNLGFIEAKYDSDEIHGRLAIQHGTSVRKNTVAEPSRGLSLTPIQEAYVGNKIAPRTWLDGGIFLGNIGAESWISKDNWTYSRALNLDYVPYYSAGLRLSHEFSETRSAQLILMNGWQNMSENNGAKAIGMQYLARINSQLTFTYNNFFGDEEVVSTRPRFRGYHNFILRWLPGDLWQYLGSLDFGHQSQQVRDGIDGWGAVTLTVRRILSKSQAIALRGEYFTDPNEANVRTSSPHGFQVHGASMNFDQSIYRQTLWRTEIRVLQSRDRIFPSDGHTFKSTDLVLTTSLSFWL